MISINNTIILYKDMRYSDFKNKIQGFPIFSSSLSGCLDSNEQLLRNQLSSWKKRGLILELKRGLYVLNENDRKINPSRVFLANQLYSPSYISTEYALMLYNLIPERVVDVTSVTTRKTKSFKNACGLFVYQHIASGCFRDFIDQKDENNYSFFIATPEKAMVDFIYLNLARFKENQLDIFEQSFRFQNYAGLDVSKMLGAARLFKSKKLLNVIEMFCQLIKKSD